MDQLAKLGPFVALSKLWKDLTGPQRVVVTAFITVALVVVGLVATVASKPRMSVLFSGLTQADAGTIVQKLSEKKITYQLSADGSTIEVPEDKVYDLRLEMATQGLPQGGSVGFELFDKSSFGMTEFTEKLSYQRAISGELTRTIEQLAPVASARVHVALSEDKVYSSEQEPVKASIKLQLRRGMPLSDEQVAGVVHLTASAVEGLKPENVTVVDSDGNMLSEVAAGSASGGLLTSNQSKIKRSYESELAQNLQSMLVRIVGPDKAVVRVSADMSFDQTQINTEKYEPASTGADGAKGVLLEEQKTEESYNNGVVPPSSQASAKKPAGVKDNYDRTDFTNRYQVSKQVQETVTSPGSVKRLSVAVIVDDKVGASKVGAIREAVTAAAGIDKDRGDQITVQSVQFDTLAQKKMDAEIASASKTELMKTIGKNAGAVVLLLVFLFFLRAIVRQIRVQPSAPRSSDPAMEQSVFNTPMAASSPASMPMTSSPADLLQGASMQGFPQANLQVAPSSMFSTASAGDNMPAELAQSTPDELVRLVRSWMAES